ncbi:NUDIX domain-containing protein [Streptomyces sp. NPDC088253]|uniref:NUDIX domain-containing protein n=1 Tax=Streptomyces sp. NPDC088253 TaxID=3365846 RepID=UPI003817E2BC
MLLICRRAPEGALSWQFGAGKVAPGETVGQAAVREGPEEAGMVVEPLAFLQAWLHLDLARPANPHRCTADGSQV